MWSASQCSCMRRRAHALNSFGSLPELMASECLASVVRGAATFARHAVSQAAVSNSTGITQTATLSCGPPQKPAPSALSCCREPFGGIALVPSRPALPITPGLGPQLLQGLDACCAMPCKPGPHAAGDAAPVPVQLVPLSDWWEAW
jgi:hypothetical protein